MAVSLSFKKDDLLSLSYCNTSGSWCRELQGVMKCSTQVLGQSTEVFGSTFSFLDSCACFQVFQVVLKVLDTPLGAGGSPEQIEENVSSELTPT